MAALPQAYSVSRQLPTSAEWVRSQIKSCRINGGQSGTDTRWLLVVLFPCKFSFHHLLHINECTFHLTFYSFSTKRVGTRNNSNKLKIYYQSYAQIFL